MGPAALPCIISFNTRSILRLDEGSLSLSIDPVRIPSCTLKLPSALDIATRSEYSSGFICSDAVRIALGAV
jgi:hypothetical protein